MIGELLSPDRESATAAPVDRCSSPTSADRGSPPALDTGVDRATDSGGPRLTGHRAATALCNVYAMQLLDRLAVRFNEAAIPLMVLKGAALNLTLYQTAYDRPMEDLDLMIHPEDVDAARDVLEGAGGLRGEPTVREDFFPRFHYETDYTFGSVRPLKVDLHVRPFRPLRYSVTVPKEAMWSRARPVRLGHGTVLVPSPEDMLIHLAVHLAVHGDARPKWLQDIQRWVAAHQARLRWDEIVATLQAWQLVLPFRTAMLRVEHESGSVLPTRFRSAVDALPTGWRDRLALHQAPRDAEHPLGHVLVSALTTPRLRFAGSYLRTVLIPDRAYMADWYPRRHAGWRACAHLLRWLAPVVRRVPWGSLLWPRTELRPSPIHGVGVFATREIRPGAVVARYFGKRVPRHGMYVITQENSRGGTDSFELTGTMKFLNHSCNPNARFVRFALVAVRPIRADEEITINYGPGACECAAPPGSAVADAGRGAARVA